MQLRAAALLVAFGPVLTIGQIAPGPVVVVDNVQPPVAVAVTTAPPNQWWNSVEKYLSNPTSNKKCVLAPMMPQSFIAKRKFASFLNVIEFYDSKGNEFGFVESWFIDWKNPFGYPGASFYLKANAQTAQTGIWRLDPQRGADGWTAPAPAPAESAESLKQKEEELFKKQEEYDREHGTKSYTASGLEKDAGFLHNIFENNQNQLSAYITGKQDPGPIGTPFTDEMTIRDCDGNVKFEAGHHAIMEMVGGMDAQYKAERSSESNMLILTDRSVPAVEMARVEMKAPCQPFPPFCAQMGMMNWFIHGDEWAGHITQPGYNESLGAGLVTIKMTDGAATDMRFLALYSSYQFSNTRWSPLMGIVTNVLLVLFFIGCCRCCFTKSDDSSQLSSFGCCRTPRGKAGEMAAGAREETEKLMKTVEAQEQPPPQSRGIMACCSRGGRTVQAK